MHYKNGRQAKNGDKVLLVPSYGAAVIGILYDAVAGNDHCNGKIAPCAPTDPMPNLMECLHLDDVLEAAKNIPLAIRAADAQAQVPLSSGNTESEARDTNYPGYASKIAAADARFAEGAPAAADPLQHRTGFVSSPGV